MSNAVGRFLLQYINVLISKISGVFFFRGLQVFLLQFFELSNNLKPFELYPFSTFVLNVISHLGRFNGFAMMVFYTSLEKFSLMLLESYVVLY